MKLLSQQTSLEKYVSELNGYLHAVSHLNDAVGYRHGFAADIIYLSGKSLNQATEEFLGKNNFELKEISLREELEILKKYIFHNFMLGEDVGDSKNIKMIKEQLGWHIQDYITIGAQQLNDEGHFVYSSAEQSAETTYLFIKISDYLVVITLHFRREDSLPAEPTSQT